MKETASILTLYAISPCHAGSGSALGVVDLPIQRERHTNWPVIASSGLKGAMRAHFDRFKSRIQDKALLEQFDEMITNYVFGSDKGGEDNSGFAGAVVVSDAKLLAFPMRSNVAPFVCITCPATLKRLAKDLLLAGKTDVVESAPSIKNEESAICWLGNITGQTLLEDMEVIVSAENMPKNREVYFPNVDKLLVVHDKVFDYGVSHCTSISAQIKIDQTTGATQSGSLRYQEEMPADSLMYSVIFWGDSRGKEDLKCETIKKYITDEVMKDFIQVGGDETCGRGIFQVAWN
ncbi:MAG: type III-B CRISPR module RAMP protein Cmr4 [Chitinivibrionales bacterium]|nr:type III-B CRISPR module RAMP protein Cmr4 [Chitinivibrionales bacterium]